MAAWLSMLRLTALEWEFKVAAYWTTQLQRTAPRRIRTYTMGGVGGGT